MPEKWVKSSFSGTSNCVEVARTPAGWFAVRDSKDRSLTSLFFDPDEWVAFIAGVKAGEFDV